MKHTELNEESDCATPNHNWTMENLTDYVKRCFKNKGDMADQLAFIGRKSAVELFRAGCALHFMREKLKIKSAYVKWLEDAGIPRTTAHEAIQLFYKAKLEKAVEAMTITKAKTHFGVVKSKPKKSSVPKKQGDDGIDSAAAHRDNDTRADMYLLAMSKRLSEVVQWDRSDLDVKHLDRLARHCIKLLSDFLLKSEKTSEKRNATHAA